MFSCINIWTSFSRGVLLNFRCIWIKTASSQTPSWACHPVPPPALSCRNTLGSGRGESFSFCMEKVIYMRMGKWEMRERRSQRTNLPFMAPEKPGFSRPDSRTGLNFMNRLLQQEAEGGATPGVYSKDMSGRPRLATNNQNMCKHETRAC